MGVIYCKKGDGELKVYTDSDYAGDLDDQKSTSGYVFLLSEGTMSWSSKKQPVVTLSTEAEFVAACKCNSVGVDMNLLRRHTTYIRSGLVAVIYIRLPTNCLYMVASP